MRIKFLRLLLLLLLTGVVLRLFYWQIFMGDQLKASAENQHFENISLPAIRGQILTSDGFALAASQPTFLLYGLPQTLSDKEKVEISIILSKVLSTNKTEELDLKNEFLTKLQKDLYWVPIYKNLNSETKKRIEILKLKLIIF